MTSPLKPQGSKTLDNGLLVLSLIAEYPGQCTLTEIAQKSNLHPTVVHRLITSLEARQLIRRDDQKLLHPGYGLTRLAASVDQSLQDSAEPILRELTNKSGATSHLVLAISEVEVMAQLVVHPQRSPGFVAFSPGRVDPIGLGSAGVAILSTRRDTGPPTPEVVKAREQGYSVSHGAIIPGITGVSAPVTVPFGLPETALGVSLVEGADIPKAAQLVRTAAQNLERVLLP